MYSYDFLIYCIYILLRICFFLSLLSIKKTKKELHYYENPMWWIPFWNLKFCFEQFYEDYISRTKLIKWWNGKLKE